MFGLGMPEILLILAIALIVIGPQKLPEVAKTLGKAMGEFKRSTQDLKNSIDIETTVNEVKPNKKKLKDIIKDIGSQDPEPEQNSANPQGSEKADDQKPDDPKAKTISEPAQGSQDAEATQSSASPETETTTSKK